MLFFLSYLASIAGFAVAITLFLALLRAISMG